MVPRDEFDDYQRALSANADMVEAAVAGIAEMMDDVPDGDVESAMRHAYAALVQRYGEFAAAVAVEFYRAVRESSGVEPGYDAMVSYPDYGGLVAWDVSDALRRSGGDVAKAAGLLAETSVQRVMGYSDATMAANAASDPARPKWAIVPHPGACAWCRLLASQGFEYVSDAAANMARHPSCKCSVVVDFDADDPRLEGYDPDALRAEYGEARKAATDGAWEEWMSLSKEERASYSQKGRGGYDRWLRNRIVAQMARNAG